MLCKWWVVHPIIIGDTDTNTGLTQEAVIFQRYVVLKRLLLPLPGSYIFHQLNSRLTLEMRSSSAVPGEAPSAGARCFPQPRRTPSLHGTVRPQSAADPFHPLFCRETLVVPHHQHPHPVLPQLVWMTWAAGALPQLRCAKESLGAASAAWLQLGFLQALSHVRVCPTLVANALGNAV